MGVLWEGPVIPTACHMFLHVPLQAESEDEQWSRRRKHSSLRWRNKLFGLLRLTRRKGGEEEEEERRKEEEVFERDLIPSSQTSATEPEHWKPDTDVGTLGPHGEGEIGAQRWV